MIKCKFYYIIIILFYLFFRNETTPKLPSNIIKKLNSELKVIKDKLDNLSSQYSLSQRSDSNPNQVYEKERQALDLKLRNLFIDCFVELFYDYNKYITKIDDEVVLNSNLLFQNRPKEDKDFYKELTESQLFEQFVTKLSKSECYYFDLRIKMKADKSVTSGDKSSVIKTKYIVEPYFEKFQKTPKNSKDLENEIKKKFENNLQYKYENGVMKEDCRILGVIKDIVEENYHLEQGSLYLLPDTVVKEEVKKKVTNSVLDRVNMINKKVELSKKSAKMVIGEPDDKEKDVIKDDIKDIIVKIFKSESDPQSNTKDKTFIIQNMKYLFVREFLIKLLYKKSEKINLQDLQFKFLSELIFQAMLMFLKNAADDQTTMEQAVFLFMSTFCYGLEGKKNTSMYDALKGKLKNFTLFMKPRYWVKWIDIKIKENGAKDIDKEIMNICNIMVDLRLDKDFVNTTIELIINTKLPNADKAEGLKTTCKTKISKVKY